MFSKLFIFFVLCFNLLAFAEARQTKSLQQDKKTDIIYEYHYFTQKKGQTIQKSLESTTFDLETQRAIIGLPIASRVNSSRIFRLAFEKKSDQNTLKEVYIRRQNRIINFLLEEKKGKLIYKSAPTQIKPDQVVGQKVFKKQIYFIQKPGQTIKQAAKSTPLSASMQNYLIKLPIIKSALSARQFHIRFANDQYQIIDVVKVVRGKSSAEYQLVRKKSGYVWKEVKDLIDTAYSDYWSDLGGESAVEDKVMSSVDSIDSIISKSVVEPTASQVLAFRDYKMVSFSQEKGEPYDEFLKNCGLSSLQKRLLNILPIYKKARSDRQFYFLFKIEDGSRLMRAVKVVRGHNQAEFALLRINHNWQWANPDGEVSSQTTFMRFPLRYMRVSSRFNMHRMHPITHKVRPHRGVDLQARYGTSVWAPAKGVVTFSGWQHGYGNVIEIDHRNGYKTKYAHLSKRLVKKGQAVLQRQPIGRVGSTGMSTGAHLHYEILVNNVPKDPMRVKLPSKKNKVDSKDRKLIALYFDRLNQSTF